MPDSLLHKKDSGRSSRTSFDHISLEEQAIVSSDSISPSRQVTAVTQGQQTAAIALRTDPKNRASHGRPPARLRQTLTVVLKIREEKRPKTE